MCVMYVYMYGCMCFMNSYAAGFSWLQFTAFTQSFLQTKLCRSNVNLVHFVKLTPSVSEKPSHKPAEQLNYDLFLGLQTTEQSVSKSCRPQHSTEEITHPVLLVECIMKPMFLREANANCGSRKDKAYPTEEEKAEKMYSGLLQRFQQMQIQGASVIYNFCCQQPKG